MPESVLGLPIHPLAVHGVVVLVPLTAVLTVIIGVSQERRQRYGVLTWLLATVALVTTWVAKQSGEVLDDVLYPSVVPPSVSDHTSLGESTPWFALALWLAVTALLLIDYDRRRRDTVGSPVLPTVVAVVAVLVAMGATGQVALTGWTGAESRWSVTIEPSS